MAKKKATSAPGKVAKKKASKKSMKVDVKREKAHSCDAFSADAFGGRCRPPDGQKRKGPDR